jgi:hypothetical protein
MSQSVYLRHGRVDDAGHRLAEGAQSWLEFAQRILVSCGDRPILSPEFPS